MQKVMIQLEVPMNIPPGDVAGQVAEVLVDTLGAKVVTVIISTEHESLIL
jgi:hypothetical protein